ncbi:glycosyltransferase [Paenibacillus sepulcri]|uniref:Glycosyltransferase n=1 Tax=Paenibacillus sepulcri TaxID=359917 RepID=A0ABS7BW02_9BACL|nr:glycosyltransferase [Paenibacillus sepulcri]
MKISSCILVKNNETTLARAIQSVKPHVDEVFILDTGSCDQSVRIAKELGAQIYNCEWKDNFAESRNKLLQYAIDFDWVLMIDSDEEFVWSGSGSFRDWIEEQDVEAVFAFDVNHYEISSSKLLSITHAERLFSPSLFNYEGIIHEKLVPQDSSKNKEVRLCQHAFYRHYGYSSEYHESKSQRNISLLRRAIELNPSEGLYYRYLANEVYNLGIYTDCIIYANTALRILPLIEQYSRAQAHYYKIMALLNIRKSIEAEAAAKACMKDIPAYADPYGILAEICFGQNRWDEASYWFKQWGYLMKESPRLLPNHCISLIETFRKHEAIAESKKASLNRLQGGCVQQMKIGVLIIHPQLENDGIDLFTHIQSKFKGISIVIGVWTDLKTNDLSQNDDYWAGRNNIHFVKANEIFAAMKRFAIDSNVDFIWIWKANERVASDLNEDKLMSAYSHNGVISIQACSERISFKSLEKRLFPGNLSAIFLGDSKWETTDALDSNDISSEKYSIVVNKPFIIQLEKQSAYMELARRETPLQQMITAFACQNYERVLEIKMPPDNDASWATFAFFRILSLINMGEIEQASELVYTAIDSDLDGGQLADFIYLYGKLSQNIQISDMKAEAIELLESTLQSNPLLKTKHVTTTESDWLALIGELQWQIGDWKQAVRSWRHSLECSAYKNEECAYRLSEAVYEQHKTEGLDKVARIMLEIFNIDMPSAQSLLYPLFIYLNMPEWALLFQRQNKISPVDTQEQEFDQVSIILPVYNDIRYLRESILSILSQTYLNLELIVVDDGSDQEVSGIIDKFKYDSRLSYYRLKENRGLPAALNYGFVRAKGAIMGWTSSDNRAHSRWLERMVQGLSAHSNAIAIHSDYYHMDENGLVLETKRLPKYKLNGLQNGGSSLLWKTAAFRQTGGFDESLFGIEDRDFTIRLALTGRIVCLPEALYYYRIHDGSLSSGIDSGLLGGWNDLHHKLKKKWLYLSFL